LIALQRRGFRGRKRGDFVLAIKKLFGLGNPLFRRTLWVIFHIMQKNLAITSSSLFYDIVFLLYMLILHIFYPELHLSCMMPGAILL
jgi:hypothetical protein